MTCGSCGILNVKHSKEEWTCRHCSTFHQRDPAAARCILIKAFDRRSSSGGSSSSDNGIQSVNVSSGQFQPTNILDASGRVMGKQQ
jgi:transposase